MGSRVVISWQCSRTVTAPSRSKGHFMGEFQHKSVSVSSQAQIPRHCTVSTRTFPCGFQLQHQQRPRAIGLVASQTPTRRCSTATNGVLVRDFISTALYERHSGYFTTREVIGSAGASRGMDFGDILGRREYLELLSKEYTNGDETWLTPTEVFHPWYARAVARYVLHGLLAGRVSPLKVIEFGGGNGTFALGFLGYLEEHAKHVYKKTNYQLVEISPSLAEKQRQRVCSLHPCAHVACSEAAAWLPLAASSLVSHDECTVVLAMEVLDNMAHDKVVIKDGKIWETWVCKSPDGTLREELRPLNDPLIMRTLEASRVLEDMGINDTSPQSRTGLLRTLSRMLSFGEKAVFVPTKAMQAAEMLAQHLKHAHFVFADFDCLPDGIRGVNGPVVQSKSGGKSTVHNNYLTNPGMCDIFFPTDFEKLRKVLHVLLGRDGHVIKQSDFCRVFGEVEKTQCLTGYNPMLEDYTNMSMLLSHWPNK